MLAARNERASAVLSLTGFLVLTYAAAAVGAFASLSAPGFYASLNLPAFAPPPWVFGPVWTVLYALIAVVGFLLARAPGGLNRLLLTLWAAQLILNSAWTWLFFRLHSGLLAFVDITLLVGVIVVLVVLAWRVRRLAAILLLPYLAWTVFATLLTYFVWTMNPGVL